MAFQSSPQPYWAARILLAVPQLRHAIPGARAAAWAELWRLVHAALFASLRMQAGRIGPVTREDLEDLASAKALELVARAEKGTWDTHGRPEHEVSAFLTRVARNGLVDHARRRGRECPPPEDEAAWDQALRVGTPDPPRPEEVLATREFAAALGQCVEALAPRSREAWFRRVFLERPSRETALRLGITSAHVDVLVQRTRAVLDRCMAHKGYSDADVRAGTFVELWSRLGSSLPGRGLTGHDLDGDTDASH